MENKLTRSIYKLRDITSNRNLHIISMELTEKKENDTYYIMIENYYILIPGSKNGIISMDNWTGCIACTYELSNKGLKQFRETCKDIGITHLENILSTTRFTSLKIFKKDSDDEIDLKKINDRMDFVDDNSEWIVTGYVL